MAEKIKESEKPRETYRPNRLDPNRGRIIAPNRVEKSPFQKVLEETHPLPQFSPETGTTQTTQTATNQAVRSVVSQQEKYGRSKDQFDRHLKENEKEKEEKPSTSTGDSPKVRAKEAEDRVIGKSSVSDRRQGEGGGHGETSSGQGQGRKGRHLAAMAAQKPEKGIGEGKLGDVQKGHFEATLEAIGTATGPTTKPKPNPLTKAVLDQIVQYCRLVTKTDGDKEIDMQLHEAIFKGLKLKVSIVEGKVEATFITQSEEVLNLFQSQKSVLLQTLAEKGIDVRAIKVIMIQPS